jgi:two-component system, LytTR family, sensor kinase
MKKYSFKDRFQFYIWVGLIWLGLWIFNSFLNQPATFAQQSLNEVWRFFYIVGVNIIFFEYSLPFIRKKRSMILFNILTGILLVSIHLLLISFGMYGWRWLGLQLDIYTALRQVSLLPDSAYNRMMYEVFYQAQGGISSTFFFGLAKLLYDNFKLRQTTQQLRLEMQEAELNYLKSQTNPHFLFNTLNNIYSLARDKSDLAQESILRLSKILRFMLYETGGKFIRAEQEMEIINDYIALEKLRYDESLRIQCTYEIDDINEPLPPLLLIPLVENAFKHGVSETGNKPYVEIHLSIHQQKLLFVVENSTENAQGDRGVKENIGLSNLRRQLALLYSDYHLDVQQRETAFTATLKINLASYVQG